MQRVGIFDSGLGGLSVWREIRRCLPHADTVYVADQTHIPYGPRAPHTVLGFARGITGFLLEQGCGTIVIACNTASAAALHTLRREYPDTTFVGMEPAIKPAAAMSRAGVVVVLATATTLKGELFRQTLERHAQGVRVLRQPCPGLVEQVERGETDSPGTRALLRVFLEQPVQAGADVCVLGCTHYAFVQPLLEQILDGAMQILDPAPAIGRRLQALLPATPEPVGRPASNVPEPGPVFLYTTGPVEDFDRVASRLLDQPVAARGLHWEEGRLHS